MLPRLLFSTALLLLLGVASSAPHRMNPADDPKRIDPRYYFCPKVFVPGRPGGFDRAEGAQACCVAGTGIGILELLFALHKCKHGFVQNENAQCWSGALGRIEENLLQCCRSHNPQTKLDYSEDDADCMARVRKAKTSIVQQFGHAYTACIRASGAERKKLCTDAEQGAVTAIRATLGAARHLYDQSEKDQTMMSEGWVNICDGIDFDRCMGKLKFVIRKYGLNYA
eukprot:g6911.t1